MVVATTIIIGFVGLMIYNEQNSLDDKFEMYLIDTYNLPENLEENQIYYESYSNDGQKVIYSVYYNTKENGIEILGHSYVDVDYLNQYY